VHFLAIARLGFHRVSLLALLRVVRCLAVMTLKPSVRHVDYVTAYIKYDYKQSTIKQRKKVMILVSKIYAKKADRKAIIMELAYTHYYAIIFTLNCHLLYSVYIETLQYHSIAQYIANKYIMA
jgi:hypothetical protein